MTSIQTERFSTKTLSKEEIKHRRTAEVRRKTSRKASRLLLLATGAVVAIVATAEATKDNANPEKAKLRAVLMTKAHKTTDPNVIIEPYMVGNRPEDVMLSGVAADMHPLTTGQNAVEESDALESYLWPNQRKAHAFTPGQQLGIAINTSTGKIIPENEIPPSAETTP